MASHKRKAITLVSQGGYDRSRFISEKAWDRYSDNVLARNILPERNVKLYINKFDYFRRELIRRNWHKQLTNLTEGSIDVEIVKEFYANLYVPDDKSPKQVRVWGHLIKFGVDSLNTFLETPVVKDPGESLQPDCVSLGGDLFLMLRVCHGSSWAKILPLWPKPEVFYLILTWPRHPILLILIWIGPS